MGSNVLVLLGNPRPNVKIDFIGDDLSPTTLHRTILQFAQVQYIYMNAVPLCQRLTSQARET